jgi:hypothetical protein
MPFFAREFLGRRETYPLSPITFPVRHARFFSAQETSWKFRGFREKSTTFLDKLRTKCNFNPKVVETDECVQSAIFLKVLWKKWRIFLHTGSGVESMKYVPIERYIVAREWNILLVSLFVSKKKNRMTSSEK